MVQATAREHEAIWDGAKTGLGKEFSSFEKAIADAASADPNGIATYRTVFDAYADLKHKGWKSPADLKKAVTDAFNAGRRQQEDKSSSSSSRPRSLTGSGSSGRSDQERLLDPDTPIDEIRQILARQR